MFVEGASNSLRLSDGCLAWAIPQLPSKKKKTSGTQQQEDDGDTLGDEGAVHDEIVLMESPAKKGKLAKKT